MDAGCGKRLGKAWGLAAERSSRQISLESYLRRDQSALLAIEPLRKRKKNNKCFKEHKISTIT